MPNYSDYVSQQALHQIRCREACNLIEDPTPVRVAVLDTGVDLEHVALKDLLGSGANFAETPVHMEPDCHVSDDFVGTDQPPQDVAGHGTMVAGVIAAVAPNESEGGLLKRYVEIIPVKISINITCKINTSPETEQHQTNTLFFAPAMQRALEWAMQNDIAVINLSSGQPIPTSKDERVQVQDLVREAHSKGCLVIAATGNAGNDRPVFPAAISTVLGVGAVTQTDERWQYSNTGTVKLVAPGVDVISTALGGTYLAEKGTSLAAPFVAGVAALVKSCRPDLTGQQVRDILIQTARRHPSQSNTMEQDNQYGYGIVDALAAVQAALMM